MIISKIERQKKQTQRYSIYLNNRFAFGVDEQVLIQFNLRKGMDLDQELVNTILKEDYQQKLYLRGLNYLSYGLRSKKEMRSYLLKLPGLSKDQLVDLRDFQDQGPVQKSIKSEGDGLTVGESDQAQTPILTPQDLVETIIQRLMDQDLINDDNYAASYVRTQAELNRKGPRMIHHELLRRGIDEGLAQRAIEEVYQLDLIEDNIHQLAIKYLKTKKNLPQKMQQMKLQQYLIQKGYPKESVYNGMQEITVEEDPQAESQLLEKEAERSLTKRKRKFQGYDLKQRVFKDLMRKGFTYEAIQEWLQVHEEEFYEEDV